MLYQFITVALSLCAVICASEIDSSESDAPAPALNADISELDELVVNSTHPRANTASTKILLADDFKGEYQDLASL